MIKEQHNGFPVTEGKRVSRPTNIVDNGNEGKPQSQFIGIVDAEEEAITETATTTEAKVAEVQEEIVEEKVNPEKENQPENINPEETQENHLASGNYWIVFEKDFEKP